MADVARVYQDDLLGARGQTDLLHYGERLETVLGDRGCAVARSLLTAAAVNGGLLEYSVVESHRELAEPGSEDNPVDDVLHVLEHDGYLEGRTGGYGFVSRLLEDWWRARYGPGTSSISQR